MRRLFAPLLALSLVLACGSDDNPAVDTPLDTAVDSADGGYCALSAEVAGSDDLGFAFGFAPDGIAATPEQIAAGTDRFHSLLDELTAAAPAELTADLELVTEVFDGYVAAVEEADFDVTAVDPTDPRVVRMSEARAASGSGVDTADARITDYNERVCGL